MFLRKFISSEPFFTLSVCECFTFFFMNVIFKTLIAQKLPRGMLFIKSFLQMCLYSNFYEAYHRVPDTYCINNDCANDKNFMKVTSNSTLQKTQKYKQLVSPKNR